MRTARQPHAFSRENRLHIRQRISHIFFFIFSRNEKYAKVEYFKPYPYRIKGLVRFESNAATSIQDSKSHRPLLSI